MKLKYIFLIALSIRLVLAPLAWHIDVANHLDWGERFFEYGPVGFYAPDANVWDYTWPNQPPGAMYIFAFSYTLYQFLFSLLSFVNNNIRAFPSIIVTLSEFRLHPLIVKLPAIFADIGIAYLVYKIVLDLKNKKKARLAALLFLFNPVIWYNSAVWGQTDATIGFFVLLSFYLLFKRRLSFSVLSFAVSLYIKVSLAIFLPIYLILFYRKFGVKSFIKPFLIVAVLIIISTLPFLNKYTPDPFNFLNFVYTKKVLVDQMHVITANAFNLWGALTGLELKSEELLLGPYSYRIWGYILSLASIVPFFYYVYKKQDISTVIKALAAVGLAVFMLATNMHERYVYPAFPYLTILAALNRKLFFAFLALSVIVVTNMYNLWWVPESFLKSLLESNFMLLRLLSLLNFIIFAYIYKKITKNNIIRQ